MTNFAIYVHRRASPGLTLFLPTLLRVANTLAAKPLYAVSLVGDAGDEVRIGPVLVALDVAAPPADVLVVPPIETFDGVFEALPEESAFLLRYAESGAMIASACLGSLMLAAAGLLDGRRATTHWYRAELARKLFPAVSWNEAAMICDDGSVVTSGGFLSAVDLVLYLIAKTSSLRLAQDVGRYVLAESVRERQSLYAYALAPRAESGLLSGLPEWLEERLGGPVSVAAMAEAFFMSVRNFHRVFLQEFGIPPHRYVQLRRVERARDLLEDPRRSLKTVLDEVGVSDAVSFRRVFQRELGLSPAAYRTRVTAFPHKEF